MLDDLIERMKEFTIKDMAIAAEMHYNQIWRLRAGVDKNPTLGTIDKIEAGLTELTELKEGDH